MFGFGNEDSLEELMKKQDKDKALCNKMKQVDKSAFVNNEFDKEMFFGKSYAHNQQMENR